MPNTPMTKRGSELLRSELHRLKTVERPSVIEPARNLGAQRMIGKTGAM